MKGTIVAATAALLAGGASAHRHGYAHHEVLKRAAQAERDVCTPECSTVYSTITGPAGLFTPVPMAEPPSQAAPAPPASSPALPTPAAHTLPTPGTYTFPASTIVVTDSTAVIGASTTVVPSGEHTVGGVTTVVAGPTTVTIPYATTEQSGSSVIKTTVTAFPTPGTYTIVPIITSVPGESTITLPVVSEFPPGTYTAPSTELVVTVTSTVFYCPFTSIGAPTTTAVAITVPVPTTINIPTTAPAQPTSQVVVPATSTTSPSSSASVSVPSGAPGVGGTDDKWALTYTTYTDAGLCKGADQVMSEMEEIHNWGVQTIRIYSTDCDTLPNVGKAAAQFGIRIIAGIFIGQPGCSNANPSVQQQIQDLADWEHKDLAELIVVANEAVFNNFCNAQQLRQLIVDVKATLIPAGYTCAFTTTDVVSAWLTQGLEQICDVIDVVGTNSYGFFNAQTMPEMAGEFVASQLSLVEGVCGNKLPGYVLETGWPTCGVCYAPGVCPGQQEQATAIASIKKAIGDRACFLSAFDEKWKAQGDFGCEQCWGMGALFA